MNKLRYYVALVSTFLMNLGAVGFSFKKICTPGFNCHGCPLASFTCPVGALSFGSAIHRLPMIALSFILFIGLAIGRLICGFICPFGLFQDLLIKIPLPKFRLPRYVRYFKYIALLMLVFVFPFFLGFETSGYLYFGKPEINKAEDGNITVSVTAENLGEKIVHSPKISMVFIDNATKREIFRETKNFDEISVSPKGKISLPIITIPNHLETANLLVDSPQSKPVQIPKYYLYFCSICPCGTLTASIPNKIFNPSVVNIYSTIGQINPRYIVFAIFIFLFLFTKRAFCRILCPLGAIYALCAKFAFFKIHFDATKCVDCGICDRVCPVELDVRKECGSGECISCGDCVSKCPKSCFQREKIAFFNFHKK